MRSFGLFAQLGIIAAAVVIVFWYTLPTIDVITGLQEEAVEYQELRTQITNINNDLAQKVAQVDGMAPIMKTRLDTYMPAQVDPVGVMRDLAIIAGSSAVTFRDLQYTGLSEEVQASGDVATRTYDTHVFSVEIEGSYTQFKQFLLLLEQNEYPVTIANMEVSSIIGDLLRGSLQVHTYVAADPVSGA